MSDIFVLLLTWRSSSVVLSQCNGLCDHAECWGTYRKVTLYVRRRSTYQSLMYIDLAEIEHIKV
jgi:hypothetical protein